MGLILYFYFGWRKLSDDTKGNMPVCKDDFVSVLVAFRNEQDNIPALIESFASQTLPMRNFEIVAVDDHSDDNGADLLKNSFLQNIKLIHLPEAKRGKKAAVAHGVEFCRGKLVVVTDADCMHSVRWLESFLIHYKKNKSKFIIGHVDFRTGGRFWHELQAVEFMSLVGSGAAAAAWGNAMYCNAANMAFEKECFEASMLNDKQASGDDVFLLHSLKKKKEKVSVLHSRDAFAYTHGATSLMTFLNQRVRWSSKSKSYTDLFSLSVASAVFVYNMFMMLSVLLDWRYTLLLFSVKLLFDYWFLSKVLAFYKKSILIKYLPFIAFLYPVYVVTVALRGFVGGYEWKGRRC